MVQGTGMPSLVGFQYSGNDFVWGGLGKLGNIYYVRAIWGRRDKGC